MTEDEIIEMARKAGFVDYELDDGTTNAFDKRYEAFAKLIAEKAIKEALAQPEQEPEWYHGIDVYGCNRFYHKTEDRTSEFNTPLYTNPPQRTWVGLTQDELNMIGDSMRTWNSWTITDVYFAIEAKLKQKNGYSEEKNT